MPYKLVVYYGGHFMTCLKYQYTGPKSKVFERLEVDRLSVREIREMVSDVVNDEDRLYFAKDGVTPDHGFKLLVNDRDVLELVKASKVTGVCKLHVFHAFSTADLPNVVEDEGEPSNNEVESEGMEEVEVVKKCTARKRVAKGKELLLEELDKDDNVFEGGEFIFSGEEDDYEGGDFSGEESDDESGDVSGIGSGSIYEIGSEEETYEDGDFAYTEPSNSVKKKRVNEPFNNTSAFVSFNEARILVFCKPQYQCFCKLQCS